MVLKCRIITFKVDEKETDDGYKFKNTTHASWVKRKKPPSFDISSHRLVESRFAAMPCYTMSLSKTVSYEDALKAVTCMGIRQEDQYVASSNFKEVLAQGFEYSHAYMCGDAECDDPNCKGVYVSFKRGFRDDFFQRACIDCNTYLVAMYYYIDGEERGYATVLYPHLGHNQRHYSLLWYKLALKLLYPKDRSRTERGSAEDNLGVAGPHDDLRHHNKINSFNMIFIVLNNDESPSLADCAHEFQKLVMRVRQSPDLLADLRDILLDPLPW